MSCVVGYIDKNRNIHMGCDSASINMETLGIRSRRDPKIFEKDNMIFGYVGSYRVGQVVRYSLKIPPVPEDITDDYDYLCSIFIPYLINCLKENDCFQYKNEGEFTFEGELMIGYNENIYIIGSDLQVVLEEGDYCCIGSGEEYAMGAFFVINEIEKDFGSTIMEPELRIELALKASAEYNAAVRAPFIVYSLEKMRTKLSDEEIKI